MELGMSLKERDAFGSLIMKKLRDEAISFADGLLRQHWKAPGLQKLQRNLKSLDPTQADLMKRTIRASVDAGVHSLLFALQEASDSGILEVRVNGKNIATLTDGLHGELFSPKGWQARFSDYGSAPKDA
jgi:hypothetical protein